jgi:uncharacterized protein YjbI with pentapeptide repeats
MMITKRRVPLGADEFTEQVRCLLAGERLVSNVEWRGRSLSGVELRDLELDHVCFDDCELTDLKFDGSSLRNCSFRNATLTRVSFGHSTHEGSDFRNAKIHSSDLRYALIIAGTFRDATLCYCDLYRAVIERGTVFEGSNLYWCSLHSTDLRGSTLRLQNLRTRLPHEDPEELHRIHQLLEGVLPTDVDIESEEKVDKRLGDASETYRHLAGCWSAMGCYRDEGTAYQRAKDLELQRTVHQMRSAPTLSGRIVATYRAFLLAVAKVLCGYGERLDWIALWIAGLALVPAAALWVRHGVIITRPGPAPGSLDYLRYSLGNMVTAPPGDLRPKSSAIDFMLVLQTLVAIPLLGLFGFVLGNRFRRS